MTAATAVSSPTAALRGIDPPCSLRAVSNGLQRLRSVSNGREREMTVRPKIRVSAAEAQLLAGQRLWSGAGSNRRPSAFQVNRAKRYAHLEKTDVTDERNRARRKVQR